MSMKGKVFPMTGQQSLTDVEKAKIATATSAQMEQQMQQLESAAKQRELEKDREHKETIDQLQHFLSETDVSESYSDFEFEGDVVLIRLFKYEPEQKSSGVIITEDIMGNTMEKRRPRIFAIGKILSIGSEVSDSFERRFKVNDVAFLPSNQVLGSMINPDWMNWVQMQQGNVGNVKGNQDIPKHVPKLKGWDRYMFIKDPIKANIDRYDVLTYLIPSSTLMAKYVGDGDF